MDTNLEQPTGAAAVDGSEIAPTEPPVDPNQKVTVEEFKISGDSLVAMVKDLIHQGNIRRIIIKNEEGRTLIEIPLTVGVIGGAIGTAVFPVVAAAGVIGAMVAHLTVVIERQGPDASGDQDSGS
ncbi:DUF4342 domain-containing protein [Romeria aff. gracilis LEGE 07310]|uniref:DUF4342 domain-containing protein n=1 Tax=Vasconcelosia minhoensis LEGE 07310 TaxID=915328 RepID=A0A8J7A3Z9_9CYAN|nr:DUF4342 domain-containing protein [Romeria gracilis]MBE9075707.1 DUF4342 domain-containing protein [Romeria aff. gracilis LEGE 07310]